MAFKSPSPSVSWPKNFGFTLQLQALAFRKFFVQVLRGKKTSLWGGDTGWVSEKPMVIKYRFSEAFVTLAPFQKISTFSVSALLTSY